MTRAQLEFKEILKKSGKSPIISQTDDVMIICYYKKIQGYH